MISKENLEQMKRGLSWFELKEGLKSDGCPICYIIHKSLKKYFEYLLREYALDVTVHKKMIAAMGMCNTHTWILAESKDELGIASLFETTLHKEIKLLRNTNELGLQNLTVNSKNERKLEKFKKEILKLLLPKGLCIACQQQKENESYYTHEMAILCEDEEFNKYYERDEVLLCRFHFLLLINETKNKDVINYFINKQRIKLDKLNYQLSEFLRKHDYRFKKEMTDLDRKSWKRLLEYLGSKPNISHKGYNDLLIQ